MTTSALKAPRRRTWLRVVLALVAVLAVLILVGLLDAWAALGTTPQGPRLARILESRQYREGKFVNTIARVEPDVWTAMARWLQGVEHSRPSAPLPIARRTAGDFATPPASDLRITWFGHSTLLVEIEGRRVLFDPVWSERCSPSSFIGPTRFHPVPMSLEALPPLDAIVISHDHYDHLDYSTIARLSRLHVPFVVPLGVGAHLEYWGVAPSLIHELDWWQETRVAELRLVATPARHFSGRGLQSDGTLWAGWAVLGKRRRVYYSGDTAMFEGFEQIGARLGPFDATMIEVGAYDALWADVHLGPEQAVAAHRAVRGGVLFPVHWGTFDLALHSWVEPAERVLAAARAVNVAVVTPRPGQSIDALAPPEPERWWPRVPWYTAKEKPVVSSGLTPLEPTGPSAPPG
ncbi:MAG TPA: MBL fold metallo-hydrolase [Polyangiaceae bacterium]|nr:MBL fold metallo-hydrolase [Polyangiaceae bacterium]